MGFRMAMGMVPSRTEPSAAIRHLRWGGGVVGCPCSVMKSYDEVHVEDVVRATIEFRVQPNRRPVGMRSFPGLVEQSMRPVLSIVLGRQSIVSMRVAEVCCEDPERLYCEDRLGCARGMF